MVRIRGKMINLVLNVPQPFADLLSPFLGFVTVAFNFTVTVRVFVVKHVLRGIFAPKEKN